MLPFIGVAYQSERHPRRYFGSFIITCGEWISVCSAVWRDTTGVMRFFSFISPCQTRKCGKLDFSKLVDSWSEQRPKFTETADVSLIVLWFQDDFWVVSCLIRFCRDVASRVCVFFFACLGTVRQPVRGPSSRAFQAHSYLHTSLQDWRFCHGPSFKLTLQRQAETYDVPAV